MNHAASQRKLIKRYSCSATQYAFTIKKNILKSVFTIPFVASMFLIKYHTINDTSAVLQSFPVTRHILFKMMPEIFIIFKKVSLILAGSKCHCK